MPVFGYRRRADEWRERAEEALRLSERLRAENARLRTSLFEERMRVMTPIPTTCEERDPGDHERSCTEVRGHDGPHRWQHEQNGWGTRRIEVVTWEDNNWREVVDKPTP